MRIESVLRRIVREVTPSAAKRNAVARAVGTVEGLLTRAAAAAEVTPRIELGGSYAHDTWLVTDTDVDFFMLYPESLDRAAFEEAGLRLAEDALKGCSPRKRYAEHPYIEAKVGGVTVNAVPCFAVAKGEWKSAADRSPFHTEYMAAHLTEETKTQVRFLKKFLKAQGIYGAEIRVHGFSGYACEVLILKYGSFEGLLRAATGWSYGVTISLEGGEKEATALFGGSPFILLDPVDVTRNLGQAVSQTKLAELVLLSRRFLEGPSERFFEKKELLALDRPPKHIRSHALLLRFKYDPRSEDILWGELWKSVGGISSHLEKDRVGVIRWSVAAEKGEASFAFLLSNPRLPLMTERAGPEVFMAEAMDSFLSASKRKADSWWLGDDFRTHVVSRNEYFTPADLVDRYMKNPVSTVGFARGLAERAADSYSVSLGEKAFASKRKVDQEALGQLAGYKF
jgi:tRNA nucleotidyltransferase (CCA-adding enzyme)